MSQHQLQMLRAWATLEHALRASPPEERRELIQATRDNLTYLESSLNQKEMPDAQSKSNSK